MTCAVAGTRKLLKEGVETAVFEAGKKHGKETGARFRVCHSKKIY